MQRADLILWPVQDITVYKIIRMPLHLDIVIIYACSSANCMSQFVDPNSDVVITGNPPRGEVLRPGCVRGAS